MTRRADTEGAEPDSVKSATLPPETQEAPKAPEPPPTGSAVATSQPDGAGLLNEFSLPNEHIDYAVLLENALTTRIYGLQSGILALETLLKGQQRQHDESVSLMNEKHAASREKLETQLDNLKTALRMAKSGVAAKDVPQ